MTDVVVSLMQRERLLLFVFPALALLSPVLEVFGTLSIPLLTPPSLILSGSIAVFGLILGAAAAALLPQAQSAVARHLFFVLGLVLIVLVVLDVATGGIRVLTAISGSRAGRLSALFAIGLVIFGAIWVVRSRAAQIAFVASAAFFLSTVALNLSVFATGSKVISIPEVSPASTDRPPFVYIVVDGAMGVDGMASVPGGESFAAKLSGLFERHGFRVHGRAFSRHFASARSIPNALNFDFLDDSWGPFLRYGTDLKVRSVLFEGLARDGYEVVSYGTEHIDFCFEPATRCEVLPSFNPFSPYVDAGQLKSMPLFQLVWSAFGNSYVLYRASALVFWFAGPNSQSPFVAIDAYAFPRWFDRFATELTLAPRGRAYFAHLLMPHAPYVFDATCRPTGRGGVGYFLAEERHLRGPAFDRARSDAYQEYRGQYGCLLSKLEAMLARLDSLPQFRDATVVIHGDHGPRISAGQYAETVSERDMIDNYSTLYAIRSPYVEPGYDSRITSVQRLTAEYLSGRGAALAPDSPTVAIDSIEAGKVVVRPMPDFGFDVQQH